MISNGFQQGWYLDRYRDTSEWHYKRKLQKHASLSSYIFQFPFQVFTFMSLVENNNPAHICTELFYSLVTIGEQCFMVSSATCIS